MALCHWLAMTGWLSAACRLLGTAVISTRLCLVWSGCLTIGAECVQRHRFVPQVIVANKPECRTVRKTVRIRPVDYSSARTELCALLNIPRRRLPLAIVFALASLHKVCVLGIFGRVWAKIEGSCGAKMGFDFEEMTRAFERIEREHEGEEQGPLPSTERFLQAMGEVNKLFEMLGSAFSFVKRDIEKKMGIISRYAKADAENYRDLNDAIAYEIETGQTTGREDGGASLSRTLLRLMWALKFSDGLLEGIGAAFDGEGNGTLRWAVSRAYDNALAEHHSWAIRRSVKGACVFLPSKEAFLERVGVDLGRKEEFLERLSNSMTLLVERMYLVYQDYGLHGLS